MTSNPVRRPLRPLRSLRALLALGLALTVAALLAGSPAASAGTGDRAGDRTAAGRFRPQVAYLNHTYAVLDRPTADAIAHSAYLRRFGAFQLRTTTNGTQTYTGRYLLGRETYLEMFGPSDLPAPDGHAGATGLAVSPDRFGGLKVVKARLRAEGVTEPLAFRQTKEVDGDQIPWFDVVAASSTYADAFPWTMQYVPSYFADPRTHSEPASFRGDVSRERYDPDDYRKHLMRDVASVEIAMTRDDLHAFVLTLRAAGFAVRTTPHGAVARDRTTTIVLDATTSAHAGWRQIGFRLNHTAGHRTVRIGHSTLVVGPRAKATWTFAAR